MKCSKICFMASSALIDHRIELKVDLIKASGKVHGQGLAVAPGHDSSQKSGGQAHVRRSVGPAFNQLSPKSKSRATRSRATRRLSGSGSAESSSPFSAIARSQCAEDH